MTRKKLSNAMCVLLLSSVLAIPKEGQGGRAINSATKNVSAKHPQPPPSVSLTPIDCQLSLAFHDYASRICPLPNLAQLAGATSMSNNSLFYCRITVEPNVPAGSYNTAVYTSTWTGTSITKMIKVPNEVTSKVTVDFYEACNSCSGQQGRAFFTYTTTISRGQRSLVAQLQYVAKANC